MNNYEKSLFIFRRDLRLEDNTALIHALNNSKKVICCFIFNKTQLENNEYRSNNCLEFMFNSLLELNEELNLKKSKLYLFYGDNEEIISKLVKSENIDSIFLNNDYTPFSISRDLKIQKICESNNIKFENFHDILLNEPNLVLKDDGKPYTIFTPYYKKSLNFKIKEPKKNKFDNYYNDEIKFSLSFEQVKEKIDLSVNENLLVKGGRKEGLDLTKKLIDKSNEYIEKRDIPIESATSNLSSHNKFGTVSIREVYYSLKSSNKNTEPIIRQLHWRDFFTQIAFHFPHVFGKNFNSNYNNVKWEDNDEKFKLWCEGKTGFPIIDAGIRELNETGYMHNRVRMIVASFLTKDLHVDWRRGEKYFAKKLVDYDPCVNNGSWQWASSTGCDAQPYFRIFNPWLQQKKFDADCKYIKKWVPELKNVSSKAIHELDKQRPLGIDSSYPKPIVNHMEEKEKAIAYYKLSI